MSEPVRPEDLQRELECVQADLQSLKLQQLRVKKAAELVASGLRRLAHQEATKFGIIVGPDDGNG